MARLARGRVVSEARLRYFTTPTSIDPTSTVRNTSALHYGDEEVSLSFHECYSTPRSHITRLTAWALAPITVSHVQILFLFTSAKARLMVQISMLNSCMTVSSAYSIPWMTGSVNVVCADMFYSTDDDE